MPDQVLDTKAAHDAVGRALPDGVSLRRMTADDIADAQALSHGFQWPFRIEDWRFAFSHAEGIVAMRDGELVGTALRWLWGPRHATVGHVMVTPRMQGQRLGQHLMHALMATLGGRTVLLHATAEGRGVYERMGFEITGEVRQHQGTASQSQVVALADGKRLRPLNRNDADTLIALDTRAGGMPRDAMIRRLLSHSDTVVLASDGDTAGFATVRRFGRGHAIGPVVAPDLESAKALIAYWCSRYAGKFLRIDVDAASGLPEWLEAQGLPRVASATTMVRGGTLERGPRQGGWALVTQALG
ncbi:MAG TPA: GNAT family N-acetyltransferase [Ramlibacter sp.]|uniref:GNAT family N-acetyltransferase n=1 Tax=Ramlibacter sp. TaxID=1917967 RepID=UPI002B607D93|nr:GNAT family N-acetyltransferase [Ramlibacter sp.]HVZ44862.1 GNAT family N-acetyltransferase [Ramlibacter sp.]